MKIKKIKSILLVVGLGAIVLGTALFFLAPMIGGAGFDYAGLDVFVAGVKALFSFNFSSVTYLFIIVLSAAMLVCVIWWGILLIAKKQNKGLIAWFFVLLAMVLLDMVVAAYFLPEVTLNGETGRFFAMVMELEKTSGKVLAIVVLVLLYVSLMFLTLYAFAGISTAVLGDDFFKKPEPVVEEKEDLDADDRKAREEAFFAACLATGEFEEYDEYEFDKPLEGYTKEPVLEEVEIEEESSVVEKQHKVKVEHTQKTTIVK